MIWWVFNYTVYQPVFTGAQVWILLILLASWIRLPEDCDIQSGYQVIELFAGKKRISKLAKSIGLVTCAHDIMYDKNFTPKKTKGVLPTKSCMDINEPAGFLFLGYYCTIIMLILCFCFGPNFHLLLKAIAPQNLNDTEPCSVRLCIITILRGRFGDLICMMGILCSTWTVVNTGTSCRDLLTPMGQQDYPSVASGNQMVSRTSPPKKGYSQTCLKHTYIYIISNIFVISLYIYSNIQLTRCPFPTLWNFWVCRLGTHTWLKVNVSHIRPEPWEGRITLATSDLHGCRPDTRAAILEHHELPWQVSMAVPATAKIWYSRN
jgi:hypothetical protein